MSSIIYFLVELTLLLLLLSGQYYLFLGILTLLILHEITIKNYTLEKKIQELESITDELNSNFENRITELEIKLQTDEEIDHELMT